MSRLTRLVSTVALGAAAFAVTFGVDSVDIRAQIANNPYKVNYNWDKLEGRKIGVASGIRLDPDGKHLWQTRLTTSVQGFPMSFAIDGTQYIAVTTGLGGGSPRRIPSLLAREVRNPETGNALYVFKLRGRS